MTNDISTEPLIDSQPPPSSGQPSPASGILNAEEAQRRAAVAVRQSLAFAQIVGVLMRSPTYKHYTLADLEWLVLPPLLTGQFSVAEVSAEEGAPKYPAAAILWASVSPDVDKRLTEKLTVPIRLRPDEWRSGSILWLVDAVGDGRIIPQFLKHVCNTVLSGKSIKLLRVGVNGSLEVHKLSDAT